MADILQRLQAGADDPMWCNHAEISKRTLRDAIDAIQALQAVVEEAKRIFMAQLVLADGLNPDGTSYTKAQKLDAKAFLAKRKAIWVGAAFDALAKVSGQPAQGGSNG